MFPTPTYLRNHHAVIEAFGYWPDFHDSPVLRFHADTHSIHLEVEAWKMTSELDPRGYFKLAKIHTIGFEFSDIITTDLDRFTPANTLFALRLSSEEERQAEGHFTVILESVMGPEFSGEFSAQTGAITFVRPSAPPSNQGELT